MLRPRQTCARMHHPLRQPSEFIFQPKEGERNAYQLVSGRKHSFHCRRRDRLWHPQCHGWSQIGRAVEISYNFRQNRRGSGDPDPEGGLICWGSRFFPGKPTSVDAMGPGAMMFEVTPSGPNSMATLCDRASTPALATDTWVWKGIVL